MTEPTTSGPAPGADSIEALAAQWEAEKPPAAGPVANVVSGAVVTALGVAGVVGSLGLGLGSAERPAAGTWPLIVSAAMAVLGVVLVVTARDAGAAERFTRTSWRVVLGLASMIGLVVVIGTIGFEIPSALLAFFWLKVLGEEGWRTSVVGSLAMVVAFYLIFVLALGTSIPHLF